MAVDCPNSIAPGAHCKNSALSIEGCHADGMVVQRDQPANLRGRARPGARVHAQFAGLEGEATAADSGKWRLRLPAQPAGGPHTLSIHCGDDRIELRDIWIGEVWLCVGQSNLVWPFSYIPEQQRAEYLEFIRGRDVRLMRMPERTFAGAASPLPALRWSGFDTDEQRALPALPALLSRLLEDRCGCKVGMMVSAVAGSRACSWIPRDAYAEDPFLCAYLRDYPPDPADYSDRLARWAEDKAAFHAANDARKRRGEPPLPLTKYIFWGPRGTRSLAYPGGAFDAMVRPLAHLPVRGILWYQGESEAEIPAGYADRLRLLMRHWRACWERESGQPGLGFVMVQLPGYDGDSEAANWPHLREQQVLAVQGFDGAFCVPTTDLGEDSELHPSDKSAFARRLAGPLAAISEGRTPPAAPRIEGYEMEEHAASAGRSLIVRLSVPVESPDGPPKGFEIVDSNGCTMQAAAELIGPAHLRVAVPIAPFAFRGLRYNWQPFPSGRLHDASGLPLLPFRSDESPPPYRANTTY